MQYPEFGTVIHGTLRNEDLLAAFADELESQILVRGCSLLGLDKPENFAERDRLNAIVQDAREVDSESEEAGWILNESLFDALNQFAPPYAYFGAHPGDGSDFGFWPSIDSLEEDSRYGDIVKVNDLSETEANQQIMLVNDHGNVTYGYTDDKNEFHEVWSVV